MDHLLASIGWPVLDRIHIGSALAISPHGVGIAAGYLFGSWWMLREGPKRGLDERHISSILFWALIGAIVGARFFYVIAHVSQFNNIGDMLKIYNGGISLIGGIAGAIIFAYPLFRKYNYRFLQAMDAAAIGLAAGVILGRIGDLIIGDHLGKPTSSFLAFRYEGGNLSGFDCAAGRCNEQLFNNQVLTVTKRSATLTDPSGLHILGHGVGVHQTGLYDFFSTILLFLFLLLVMSRRPWREGVLISTWAVWYLGVRVWTDFLRVDKRFFGLTGSQWASAIVAGIAALALIRWAIQAKRAGPKPEEAGARSAPTTAFTPPPDPSA